METNHVDIKAANTIQTLLANAVNNSEDPEYIIKGFVEAGYDETEVRETVEAGLEELRATYA